MIDQRSETRHIIPAINRKYVKMAIRVSDTYVPAERLDFSLHGLKFVSPVKSEVGSTVACKLSIPTSMSREVFLKVTVRHRREVEGHYIMGGEIVEVEDALWFDMFRHVQTFLIEREGEIY